MPKKSPLLTLPMYCRRSMVSKGPLEELAPWGAPILFGVRGVSAGTMSESEILIAHEWPIPFFEVPMEYPKEALEQLHVRRILSDFQFYHRRELLKGVTRGNDPPDFVAMENGVRVSVDLAQYTVEARRAANARFEKIKAFVRARSPELAHLRGHTIYFWMLGDSGVSEPDISASAMEELVDALKGYSPNPTIVDRGPFPKQHPGIHTGTTTSGTTFYAHPMLGVFPQTLFFLETGFELGLSTSTQVNDTEARAEITRLISKHDQPSIEQLFITAGSPDRRGYCYLSDETIARLAVGSGWVAPEELKYLKAVHLHFWSSGEIYRLYPNPAAIVPRLFHMSLHGMRSLATFTVSESILQNGTDNNPRT